MGNSSGVTKRVLASLCRLHNFSCNTIKDEGRYRCTEGKSSCVI